MTKLFICLVLCLLLAMPAIAQLKKLVIEDFEDAGVGVSHWEVASWSCTGEEPGQDIISWAVHPDSPPGNLGVLKAVVNFDLCASTYIRPNVSNRIVLYEEGNPSVIADSATYDVYLPADIPDGIRIYMWIGTPVWVAGLDAYKTTGGPVEGDQPGPPLVPGAWNRLTYPIKEKIDAGAFAATDTVRFGWQHWPNAEGYTGTLYMDNFTLWGIGEEVPVETTMIEDFEDAGVGVSHWEVASWSCTGEEPGQDIISWAVHPDSPPGNLGVLKAVVNFDLCASTYIRPNVSNRIVLYEEGNPSVIADSATYDVYLPADIPDGIRIYMWIGTPVWVAGLDAYKTTGGPVEGDQPGPPLVPGAWNRLTYPIKEKIDAGAFAATDTVRFGWQHWPNAEGYTGTLYMDNFMLWGIGEVTTIETKGEVEVPKGFFLSRAYPNPFNPITNIDYSIPHATDVSIIVYDVVGRPVKTLVNDRKSSGNYRISWDGTNDVGQVVSSGTYLMKMVTNEFSQSQKFTLLK